MEHKKRLCGQLGTSPEAVASNTCHRLVFRFAESPYLTATLSAAINRPFVTIPVLNSVVVAVGRWPQLIGQLSVLFSLKEGGRPLVSHLVPSHSGSHYRLNLQGLALRGWEWRPLTTLRMLS